MPVAVAAAAALQSIGTIAGGLEAGRAGKEAQRAARLDADAAERATRDAVTRTLDEADEVNAIVRARAAAAGLDLVGSPMEVILANLRAAQKDAAAIGASGATEVRRSLYQGAEARRAGRVARTGAFVQAGTSFVSTLAAMGRTPDVRGDATIGERAAAFRMQRFG